MIDIYKPMLTWLMDRPTLVCWLFVVIVGPGLRRLDEAGPRVHARPGRGSILDMPTTVPRASITEAADDLKARDAVLRGFPEVWQVVGKAGRAETPTDPSPLDMVETVINLRDRELWPKRKLKFEDAAAQTRRGARRPWRRRACCDRPGRPSARGLVNEAAMTVASRVDATLRDLAVLRLDEFRPELGRALVGEAVDALLGRVEPGSRRAEARPPAERSALVESLATTYADRLAARAAPRRRHGAGQRRREPARRAGRAPRPPDLLNPPPGAARAGREAVGRRARLRPADLFTRIADQLVAGPRAPAQGADQARSTGSCSTAPSAPPTGRPSKSSTRLGRERKLLAREAATPRNCQALRAALDKPFADRLLLWQKTKNDLVEEMSTGLQMPGWGNIFTQPIVNRIEMLSTGVRLPIGVKVFGTNLDEIQQRQPGDRRGAPRRSAARPTSSPTRSSARATSRSRSTARRRPATASTSATSRT